MVQIAECSKYLQIMHQRKGFVPRHYSREPSVLNFVQHDHFLVTITTISICQNTCHLDNQAINLFQIRQCRQMVISFVSISLWPRFIFFSFYMNTFMSQAGLIGVPSSWGSVTWRIKSKSWKQSFCVSKQKLRVTEVAIYLRRRKAKLNKALTSTFVDRQNPQIHQIWYLKK